MLFCGSSTSDLTFPALSPKTRVAWLHLKRVAEFQRFSDMLLSPPSGRSHVAKSRLPAPVHHSTDSAIDAASFLTCSTQYAFQIDVDGLRDHSGFSFQVLPQFFQKASYRCWRTIIWGNVLQVR